MMISQIVYTLLVASETIYSKHSSHLNIFHLNSLYKPFEDYIFELIITKRYKTFKF